MGLRTRSRAARAGSPRCSRAPRAPARRWPPSDRPRARSSTCTRSTCRASSASTSARPRRTSSASSRAAEDGERDPLLRRGRRALRQALRGQGRARPLRQHRDRLPAAAHRGVRGHRRSSPPTCGRTSTRRSSRRIQLRRRVPVPRRGAAARASGGGMFPARGAARRRRRPSTSWRAQLERRRRRHPQRRARRGVPRGGRRRTHRHGAPPARDATRVREDGPALGRARPENGAVRHG